MKLKKILKYGIVGLLGTFIHFGILLILVELFLIHPVLSSSIGFIVVVVISYFLNKKWTFQSENGGYNEFIKYLIVSCSGLVINTVIMYCSVNIFQFEYFVGQLIVTIVIPLSNYTLNSFWTFKEDFS